MKLMFKVHTPLGTFVSDTTKIDSQTEFDEIRDGFIEFAQNEDLCAFKFENEMGNVIVLRQDVLNNSIFEIIS